MIKTFFQKSGAGALTMLVPSLLWAQDKAKWNFQEPHTSVAREMYDLHTLVLVICLVICLGVFGAMVYSIVKHRKSAGHKAAHFHENTTVEILWTVIPFFIQFFNFFVGTVQAFVFTLLAIVYLSLAMAEDH